jgi:hypothetical protein
MQDFDFQIKIKTPSSPDTQWCAGMVIGYQDNCNYYAFEITSVVVNLKHIADSVSSLVATKSLSLPGNTWHSMHCRSFDGLLSFYHGDEYLFAIVDHAYAEASIGLFMNNMHSGTANMSVFDDITIHQR